MRKLASIQKITNITPIVGADNIEVASVLGWDVVITKKDNFSIGDNVVYIEIDSILPERPVFEFLRNRKFRVRTIRLRQQISQGICFPLSILPLGKYEEGEDVTDILGVTKYDPQAVIENKLTNDRLLVHKNRMDKFLKRYKWYRSFIRPSISPFPSFIKKTDEDRIQLFPGICEHHKDTMFNCSEKLDGTSVTYFIMRNPVMFNRFFKPYLFGVCSRNRWLTKPNNSVYWDMARKESIKDKLISLITLINKGEKHPCNYIVLQGEIIGPKIQGNKYECAGFYAFNLFYNDRKISNLYLSNTMSLVGLDTVPMLPDMYLKPTIKENLILSNGVSKISNTLREGLVLRNHELGLSFKIVSPEFLLSHEE